MLTTRSPRWIVCFLGFFATVLTSCDPNSIAAPDPSLQDFVGAWDATRIDLVDRDGLMETVDAIALGVAFFVNIEPSGAYTAIASAGGVGTTEIGRLSFSDGRLTLTTEFPSAGVREAEVTVSGDVMELAGDSFLSFISAGTSSTTIEVTLLRRP